MADVVRVRPEILREMLEHARREPQIECCGLLAGSHDIITTIFPAQNTLASATAYEIAPRELFQLFRSMREQKLVHLGVYHSHPSGENVPSPRDIEQASYPAQAYFVISPLANVPSPVRAFSVCAGGVKELRIDISTPSKLE